MGATSEQMTLIDESSMDHVSYILVLLSVACVVFLFVNVLLHIYDRHDIHNHQSFKLYVDDFDAENAHAKEDGHELRSLISDDDDDPVDEAKRVLGLDERDRSFENSSRSTVGENSQAYA